MNEKELTVNNDCRLTTFDNPFDPFEQFNSWYLFDTAKGYNTCSYLARVLDVSDDMSEEEVNEATEAAIDSIIENDFLNIYKKVWRNGEKKAHEGSE